MRFSLLPEMSDYRGDPESDQAPALTAGVFYGRDGLEESPEE